MRNFEFINMPDYYTRFLRENMQVGSKSYNYLRSEIYNNKSLNAIFKNSFSDIDPNLDIDVVVKSMGWDGFRNRLTSLYINYNEIGRYEVSTNKFLCSDALEIEQTLKKFSVTGYSRGFLLGFYLKLWSQQLKKNKDSCFVEDLLDLSGPVMEVLEKSRSRIISVDWAVVSISLLLRYISKEIVISLYTQETEFVELFQILDNNQKSEFVENLLAYGSSINDHDFFQQM